jgi:hypothetical protein
MATNADLKAKIATGSTDTLTGTLTLLVAKSKLDDAERKVRSFVVDELCDRFPHLLAAVDAWIDDDDSPHADTAEVVLAELLAPHPGA